jgi:hypothetical protein
MHVTNENRKKPRVRADMDMRFELGGKAGVARVRDISASGVRCLTDRALPLMTQVELVIVLPAPGGHREVVCRGAVVRSTAVASPETSKPGKQAPEYETAIFFTQMRDSDRTEVEEFVSSARRTAEL